MELTNTGLYVFLSVKNISCSEYVSYTYHPRVSIQIETESLSMRKEMDEKVFISSHSWHCSFIVKMIEMLFPNCTFTCRVNDYVPRQGKGINRRNESNLIFK